MNYILQAKLIHKSYTQNKLHFTDITIARGKKLRFGVETYTHQILTIRENTTSNDCINEHEKEYNTIHSI
jgi:hypothetical protein